MADARTISLSIYRYNPEVDAKPYMKDYKLEIPNKSDPMLLTLLERLKTEVDPTITGTWPGDGHFLRGAVQLS